MRPSLVTLLCVVIVAAAAARASAAPDAVDRLLFGDSPVVEGTSVFESHVAGPSLNVSAVPSSAGTVSSAGESSGFSHKAPWNTPADSRLEIGPVNDLPVALGDHEELPPATPMTAVPEPSAIFLALAALVYFLIFGRRRRV